MKNGEVKERIAQKVAFAKQQIDRYWSRPDNALQKGYHIRKMLKDTFKEFFTYGHSTIVTQDEVAQSIQSRLEFYLDDMNLENQLERSKKESDELQEDATILRSIVHSDLPLYDLTDDKPLSKEAAYNLVDDIGDTMRNTLWDMALSRYRKENQ